MRDYKLFLEGFDVDAERVPSKFEETIKATDEHHAKQIALRVWFWATLVGIVEIV